MSYLKVFLLGPPHVEYNDQPVKIGRRKSMALLAYLALTGETQARDTLATLFWPESDQTHARTALRMALSTLKKAVGDKYLAVERESVSLREDADLWVDVNHFRQYLETCRGHAHPAGDLCTPCINQLSEAADLYRGDFLAGFGLRDCPDFDDWQYFQTESLRLELASILERLAQMLSASQDFEPAIQHTRRWVKLDILHEPAHRQLMQLYAQSGQPAAALRQYETCVQVLETELGLPPQEETEQLYQAIHKKRVFKASSASQRYGHSLPHQVTPFVGREQEILEIGQIIERGDSRLISLVGPGGIGKTRLALEAANGKLGAFLQGVHFVPLAGVNSVAYLPSAIVDTLNISLFGQENPQAQLLNYLRHKEMLLVLDNFEHLLAAGELLSEILSTAPGVTLLVTSRERLNLQGEWVVEIQGLRFPKQEEHQDIETYSAVQLFTQSAHRACPDFRLGEQEKPWVVRICRLVEGMPLALELAAAWTQALSCAEIAAEIESNLDFLSSSLRDIPDRHRSIRATFNHSWGFLTEAEKETLAKLAVFRGGFTRAAAQEVAAASPVQLAGLIEKSFLRWNAWSGRYEMHELLRQYAAEKLDAVLEREARDRHSAYFMAFLARREAALTSEGQLEALHEIETEIENIRQAWGWAVQNGQAERIGRGLESLFHFYDISSWFREGREVFDEAATALEEAEASAQDLDSVVWKLRARQGMFEFHLDQYLAAKPLLQQGLAFFRTRDDQAEMAFGIIGLSSIILATEAYRDAVPLLEQAISYAQSVQRVDLEARIHLQLGRASWLQGDYEAARLKLKHALSRSPQVSRLRSDCLGNLGIIESYLGNRSTARTYLEQALPICRQIGDRFGEAATLIDLGNLAANEYNHIQAKVYYEQAILIQQEIGDRGNEGVILVNLGILLDRLGDFSGARQCYEQALQISRETQFNIERYVLISLGLLYHHLGDDQASREFSQQALQMSQEAEDRRSQGAAFTNLGHALNGLGKPAEAAQAYQQAAAIWRDLGEHNMATEPLAGLARLALAQREISQAQEYVEEILSYLETNTLGGTEEPQRVYLTCYQVLDACQDARAREILATSYHAIQEQAARISNEALQHSFLENIPAHREIVRLWEATA